MRRVERRINRRSALRIVAGLSSVAVAAGCGRTASPGQPGAAAGACQPKPGGTYNLIETNDFFDFDPTYQGSDTPNGEATMQVYDTVLDFDRSPDIDWVAVNVKPRLAAKWETPDSQTYTCHLQPNVKFQNIAPLNGRSFTSNDVKWTLEYLSRTGQFAGSKLPTPPYASTLSGLQSVEAPDPSTMVVKFDAPYAPFLNYPAAFSMAMLPHELYVQDGNLHNKMIGTGPFICDAQSSKKGSQWVFNKNPDNWQQGKPYVDKIRYLVINDLPSQRSAFQAKQADLVRSTADPTAAKVLKALMPGGTVKQATQPSPILVMLNARNDIFKEIRVRQAISLAVDREAFNQTLSAGTAGWPMVAGFGLWTQEEIKKILMHQHDLQQARTVPRCWNPKDIADEQRIKLLAPCRSAALFPAYDTAPCHYRASRALFGGVACLRLDQEVAE